MVLKLDGTGFVQVPDSQTLRIGAELTLFCRFIDTYANATAGETLIEKGSPGMFEYKIRSGATAGNSIYQNSGASTYMSVSGGALAPGVEFTVAGTYKQAVEAIVFVNGSQVSRTVTATGTAPVGMASPLGVGARPTSANIFTGDIIEAAVFSSSLLPTDIADLHSGAKKPIDFASCVMWHDYRTGTAQDQTSNGNNGTLVGGASLTTEKGIGGLAGGSTTTLLIIAGIAIAAWYFFLRKN